MKQREESCIENRGAHICIYSSHSRRSSRDFVHRMMATSSRILHNEHDNEYTLLKWPPQSPDLNPIEHLWDVVEWKIHIMDMQATNLQQLHDAIMSIWTKISEECFQHLVESMPRRIKTVLKKKGCPILY